MTFTADDALDYITAVRWQFARTMPQWPHEYTVRTWRPELQGDFAAMVALIRREGTVKPWPGDAAVPRYYHTYLQLGDWEYWTMDGPADETTVINRALLQESAAPAGPAAPPLRITWYAIRSFPSQKLEGLFVHLAGDQPPGAMLLRWNGVDWVNGSESCTRYLSWGEPGAEEVSEEQAAIILDSLGGSLAGALTHFAEVGLNIHRQWQDLQRAGADGQGDGS